MPAYLLSAFLSELLGILVIMLLGIAICANLALPRTKGHGENWLLISLGWGLAVFVGVYVAFRSGAHLNPAVTLGLLVAGTPFNAGSPGVGETGLITATLPHALVYIGAQVIGAFLGAILAWLAFKPHYDLAKDPDTILGTFATSPAIRRPLWNFIAEFIATFVLVFWVQVSGPTPSQLGPLAVALVVVVIGLGLGGLTGYAINPARDFGPRLAHQLLPIPGKGRSDWAYAWIPIVSPLLGGIAAGLAGHWWSRF